MILMAILNTGKMQDGNTVYQLASFTPQNNTFTIADNVQGDEAAVVNYVQSYYNRVGTNAVRAVNFSIESSRLKDSAGSFKRLHNSDGSISNVVLAVYVSQQERILGYFVADARGVVHLVKREVLLQLCKQGKSKGINVLHNAFIRTTDGVDMIVSYPSHDFLKIKQKLSKTLAEPKIPKHIQEGSNADKQEVLADKPKSKSQIPIQSAKPIKSVKEQQVPVKNSDRYSEAQKKELIAAKSYGVNPLIISNPKLTPEQMRIIWTAKANNINSEYFANPKFSVEQMNFFAERLVSKEVFNECKGIINPRYSVDQLTELYLGIYGGIDYTLYADPALSAEEMYIKRTELSCETYAAKLIGVATDDQSSKFLKKIGKASLIRNQQG